MRQRQEIVTVCLSFHGAAATIWPEAHPKDWTNLTTRVCLSIAVLLKLGRKNRPGQNLLPVQRSAIISFLGGAGKWIRKSPEMVGFMSLCSQSFLARRRKLRAELGARATREPRERNLDLWWMVLGICMVLWLGKSSRLKLFICFGLTSTSSSVNMDLKIYSYIEPIVFLTLFWYVYIIT